MRCFLCGLQVQYQIPYDNDTIQGDLRERYKKTIISWLYIFYSLLTIS